MGIQYEIKSLFGDWFSYFKIIALLLITPYLLLILYQLFTGNCYTPSCSPFIEPIKSPLLANIFAILFEIIILLIISISLPLIVFFIKTIVFIATMGIAAALAIGMIVAFGLIVWLVIMIFNTYGFVDAMLTLGGFVVAGSIVSFLSGSSRGISDNSKSVSDLRFDSLREEELAKDFEAREEARLSRENNSVVTTPVNENLYGPNPYTKD